MCIYIYIYTYIYIYIYTRTHTYIYIYIYTTSYVKGRGLQQPLLLALVRRRPAAEGDKI